MRSIVCCLLAALAATAYAFAQDPHRVVIQEIMADPSPPLGLPDQEYVELRNISPVPVDLKHWRLRNFVLPAFVLQPDSCVVLSARPLPVPGLSGAGFPSLRNERDTLVLYDNAGRVAHAVAYDRGWHRSPIRENGGWSLEMIDAGHPCARGDNWESSPSATGGTPGRPNAAARALQLPPPTLVRAASPDSVHTLLYFSSGLDSATAASVGRYAPPPSSVVVIPPFFDQVLLTWPAALTPGTVRRLEMTGLRSCEGRELEPAEAVVARPLSPDSGDIVINELLFDPPTGAEDFAEILNCSPHALELEGLLWAGRGADGNLRQAVPLVPDPYLLLPGEYLAFTADPGAICRNYTCKGRLEQISSLPTLPPDRGEIILLRRDGRIIDMFAYDDGLHFPTLASTKGVSLERLRPDRPATARYNWHSAAGGATPGYLNSQQLADAGPPPGQFSLYPSRFSPDNDGVEDVATVSWTMDGPGFVGNITVLDGQGRSIRHLAGNLLLGSGGSLVWDGLDDARTPVLPGIYLVFARIFDRNGRVRTWKLPLVLTRARK
ncbi:lamin tail domain-containing protein [Chitinophaga lutea]